MLVMPTTLPDLNHLDQDGLKAIIVAQHQQLTTQHEQLQIKDEQLLSREQEIAHLKLLLAKLRRMQFGRKSEKVAHQIEQLELKLEELEASMRRRQSHRPVPRTRIHLQPRLRGVHCPRTCRARPGLTKRKQRRARSAAAG